MLSETSNSNPKSVDPVLSYPPRSLVSPNDAQTSSSYRHSETIKYIDNGNEENLIQTYSALLPKNGLIVDTMDRNKQYDLNTGTVTETQNATLWGKAKYWGGKTIDGLDYLGEGLGWVLGITTPRFADYLDDAIEYQNYLKEKEKQDIEDTKSEALRNILSGKSNIIATNTLTKEENAFLNQTKLVNIPAQSPTLPNQAHLKKNAF